MPHRKLAHGDAAAGAEVELTAILHEPAGCLELRIDRLARTLFWSG
jgi:hypothetical protein